jgi:hypothetical protein
MSTTTRPHVDVEALTNALHGDAAHVMATTLVCAFRSCAETDNPLNDHQQAEFIEWALSISSGLRASFTKTLIDELEREGVDAWGLS